MTKEHEPLEDQATGTLHLCIGAPWAGTRWLHNCLMQLPNAFTPLVKEVRFWHGQRSPEEFTRSYENALANLDGLTDERAQAEWLKRWKLTPDSRSGGADKYRSLMAVAGKASIDISPSYCLMPEAEVSALYRQLPKSSKIAYFVRDVTDRSLIQMNMHFHVAGRYRGEATVRDYTEFLTTDQQMKRNDYAGTYACWQKAFGDRFRIFFYDDIVQDPAGTLKAICSFFGITSTKAQREASLTDELHRESDGEAWPATKGRYSAMRAAAAKCARPAIKRFGDQFPDRVAPWVKNASSNRNQPPPKAALTDLPPKVERLMRMSESLGDNGEYGHWQQDHGYEPESLFRWATAHIAPLIRFLEGPGEILRPENLSVHGPGFVCDTHWDFKFPSRLVESRDDGSIQILSNSSRFKRVHAGEHRKINALSTKFFSQATTKPAVYLIKNNYGIEQGVAERLSALLTALNPQNCLVLVKKGPSESIERVCNNFYEAEIPRFATHIEPDVYHAEGWTRLMINLSLQPEIEQMIDNMTA